MAKAPRSFVLGTAGHIDHGKTTLVGALTGTDTDRLPEEKRRGITIELGFAPWTISSDLLASIVDVPGHEGFVRTMVAGAGGIDAVILVVSAEDGVMPQTREHINVCRLLGIEHGVVALTKIDRLEDDEEAIELAVDDVRESLAGTVFEEATIVPCSAVTKEGLDTLRSTVKKIVSGLPRRDTQGAPLVPLDRVFTIKGHGTVVTGTLLSGLVDVGKDSMLELVPTGEGRERRPVRARAAQVRGSDENRVPAGCRIALNVAGLEVSELHRGDVLTRGDAVVRTTAFHATLRHLPGESRPWKHGTTVQVCGGTAFAIGRLDPLEVTKLPETPGEPPEEGTLPAGGEGLVRVRLETPIPVWRDMHVVVRDFSGPKASSASMDQGHTIGGGTVVDPEPSTGRGQRARWIAVGRALASDDLDARLVALVHDAGARGLEVASAARRSGIRDAAARLARLSEGKKSQVIDLGGGCFGHVEHLRPLIDAVVTGLDRWHAANPMQPGASRATVEAMLGGRVAPRIASWAVEQAVGRGALRAVDDAGTLARPDKGVAAGAELPQQMQEVLDVYAARGLNAPTIKEVAAACDLAMPRVLEIVGVLQRTRRLVKVTPDISLTTSDHDALVDDVRKHLAEHGTIDVQALKAMTGLSRKYAVPLMEHFDHIQVTRREGDLRKPGPRAKPA